MIYVHVNHYVEARRSSEALGKMMIRSDKLRTPITPYIQAKTLYVITDQWSVREFIIKPMTNKDNRAKEAMAAEVIGVKEAHSCSS